MYMRRLHSSSEAHLVRNFVIICGGGNAYNTLSFGGHSVSSVDTPMQPCDVVWLKNLSQMAFLLSANISTCGAGHDGLSSRVLAMPVKR